jgi:ATP-dependent exoDNAse (exonuclease V) beta subunit
MGVPLRKVITASAGTGKTYRLSLEFINLLLQYRNHGIGFEEILVITFTRKATAEIRSAIFKHLNNLLSGNEEGKILQENLSTLFGTLVEEKDLQYLKTVYEQMLVNKHRLQISTIDSFVHGIFKAVIAPYTGISDFRIDNEINTQYLPDLYNHIFRDSKDSEAFIRIFRTAGKNTIEQYDRLILSLLENRWLLHLIKEKIRSGKENPEITGEEGLKANDEAAADYLTHFQQEADIICAELSDYLRSAGMNDQPAAKCFLSGYRKIVSDKDCRTFLNDIRHLFSQESFLARNWKEFSKSFRFWSKNGIKDKDLKASLEDSALRAQQSFCGYIFHRYLLTEEREILLLADHILEEYDRLKMRDKIFTYSDIAYYTFRYLYDPELSLIDPLNDSVSNRFYEYLSARTRFMLIDEFQDTGIIQHKLLFPIISEIISGSGSKEYGGVIVVGDEKQSIYGWRNGERELLLNMPRILQTEDAASLNTTYRSSRFITNFINRLFAAVSQELQACSLDWFYAGDIASHSESEEGFLGFYFLNTSSKVIDENSEDDSGPFQKFVETVIKPLFAEGKIDPAKSVVLARDNRELKGIAEVLEENGIGYFLESSFSFLEHQSIKPVIHFLRYLAEKDVLHLLRFLRSDVALLPAAELKQAALLYEETHRLAEMGENDFLTLLKERCGTSEILRKTVKLLELAPDSDPVELTAMIIKEFNITGHFPEEHNVKNLHLFLETVSQFQAQNRSDYRKNLSGLLRFLADNEKNEDFRQANIDNIDSLQLMTVHKAKGLEFDNVFMFYNVSGRGGQDQGRLIYLYRFNESFTEPEEFRISYNYSALLKYMNYPLQVSQDDKELLEEMNNIYVALTRAKANIFLFLAYENKEGMFAAAEPSKDDLEKGRLNIKKLFLKSIINYLEPDSLQMRENGEFATNPVIQEIGEIPLFKEESLNREEIRTKDIGNLLKMLRKDFRKQPEDKEDLYHNFRRVYLENKQSLYGDLAHYYLSLIKYGEGREKSYARKRTLAKYGNRIPERAIREAIAKLNLFIDENKTLFDRKWSLILTEKTVFDKYGREQRIDRMMIDENEKRILLVDYKTGSVNEKDQLARYKRIIEDMPRVQEGNYHIATEYIEVRI